MTLSFSGASEHRFAQWASTVVAASGCFLPETEFGAQMVRDVLYFWVMLPQFSFFVWVFLTTIVCANIWFTSSCGLRHGQKSQWKRRIVWNWAIELVNSSVEFSICKSVALCKTTLDVLFRHVKSIRTWPS